MTGHRDPSDHLNAVREAHLGGGASRDGPGGLVAEHLALRRVAELVAKGTAQEELFARVAVEASELIGEDISLLRIERDGVYTVIASHGGPAPVGTQFA